MNENLQFIKLLNSYAEACKVWDIVSMSNIESELLDMFKSISSESKDDERNRILSIASMVLNKYPSVNNQDLDTSAFTIWLIKRSWIEEVISNI